MAGSLGSTVRFFAHLVRDVVGTLRERWFRFFRRVVRTFLETKSTPDWLETRVEESTVDD